MITKKLFTQQNNLNALMINLITIESLGSRNRLYSTRFINHNELDTIHSPMLLNEYQSWLSRRC